METGEQGHRVGGQRGEGEEGKRASAEGTWWGCWEQHLRGQGGRGDSATPLGRCVSDLQCVLFGALTHKGAGREGAAGVTQSHLFRRETGSEHPQPL